MGCDCAVTSRKDLVNIFQSTQPEWAATCSRFIETSNESISIHAARMGCDAWQTVRALQVYNFNPRSPNGLRPRHAEHDTANAHFNPRSPNGLRLPLPLQGRQTNQISIHAARMGCDLLLSRSVSLLLPISIHAARMGCDSPAGLFAPPIIISIHAARMGCDF